MEEIRKKWKCGGGSGGGGKLCKCGGGGVNLYIFATFYLFLRLHSAPEELT